MLNSCPNSETHYHGNREVIEQRLRFEDFISDLSEVLLRVPFAELDREIGRALSSIRLAFAVDSCAVMEVCADRKQMQTVSVSCGEASEPIAPIIPKINGFSWIFRRLVEKGEPVAFSSPGKVPPGTNGDRDFWENSGIEALLLIPVHFNGEVTHLIGVASSTKGREWPENYPPRLQLLGEMIAKALIHRGDREALLKSKSDLARAFAEIRKLKEQLGAEKSHLRQEMISPNAFTDIIGKSDALRYVLYRIEQVAPTKTTILLTGETGTGKGLLARALHDLSTRRSKPFVNVNCAGLPPNLIESELFGREKGAFTGSTARQIGRFEFADGGTIFLDEIGEFPLELQAKLLKVIDEEEFERLGNPRPIKVDVRIIASTNRNLKEEITSGRFRSDLFYRLNVFPITIPPLRERREDIPLLVKFYVEKFGLMLGKGIKEVPESVTETLENYSWPGNIRELINVIERAVIVSDGPELRLAEKIEAVPSEPVPAEMFRSIKETGKKGLVEVEREHILTTLREIGWIIEGNNGAARLLGMNPSTLRSRMRKLGITRPATL